MGMVRIKDKSSGLETELDFSKLSLKVRTMLLKSAHPDLEIVKLPKPEKVKEVVAEAKKEEAVVVPEPVAVKIDGAKADETKVEAPAKKPRAKKKVAEAPVEVKVVAEEAAPEVKQA